MKSIRTFLVVVVLATITLTVFLSALHGYRSSMTHAQQIFDIKMSDAAHLLAGAQGSYLPQQSMTVATAQYGFQVWDNGALVQHSVDIPKTPITRFEPGFGYANFNNYRWRTYAIHSPGNSRWILLAERDDLRSELGERIIMKSVLPVVVTLPLAGLLIWFIVGYGLSPLRTLADRLGKKGAGELNMLPLENQPRELVRLVESINDLLRRLDSSFEREKRFSTDAAHELRTPISALKVHLHNLEREYPPGHADLQQVSQATERMGRIVEQILLLNRVTPELYKQQFSPIDLHALVQQYIADHYLQFENRSQTIELEGDACSVRGDRFALETLLQNLLENACKYTPAGGDIRVRLEQEVRSVLLIIEDSGPGIPAGQHERIFDRFYRLGGDQHASGVVGCGLGLSIVRQIAELHHAQLTMSESSFSSGLRVTLRFPAASGTTLTDKRAARVQP